MVADRDARPRAGSDRLLSIRVTDLEVNYRVYEDQRLNTRDVLSRGFRSRRHATVTALRGVSFDVAVGEAVGIVGSNGSGKSTLLRAIAGLQSRESGSVLVRAQPQLLAVNAALMPALSGYRNVMLGGLAMGMSPTEIEEQMPAITEFSGLGGTMARPLKTYSSGMRARLAFSIATLRTPEILLIDEALAVGDRSFRRRSLKRIKSIRDEAGTVVMVTHNLNEIRKTCSRALWLDQGRLIADGRTEEVLAQYEAEDPDD